MRLHSILSIAALALTAMLLAAQPAFAQNASNAGLNLLNTFQGAITGNIGFFLGLAIAFFGVWTWVVNQNTGAGILMIIGGVLITLVPSLFTGARNLVGGVVSSFSGTTSNQVSSGLGRTTGSGI